MFYPSFGEEIRCFDGRYSPVELSTLSLCSFHVIDLPCSYLVDQLFVKMSHLFFSFLFNLGNPLYFVEIDMMLVVSFNG